MTTLLPRKSFKRTVLSPVDSAEKSATTRFIVGPLTVFSFESGSALDRFEYGVEIEPVTQFQEFFAQLGDVDGRGHVNGHLHGEHVGAGMRRRVTARCDFGDLDV